jgi:hypothetical protein
VLCSSICYAPGGAAANPASTARSTAPPHPYKACFHREGCLLYGRAPPCEIRHTCSVCGVQGGVSMYLKGIGAWVRDFDCQSPPARVSPIIVHNRTSCAHNVRISSMACLYVCSPSVRVNSTSRLKASGRRFSVCDYLFK